jgi:GNAT superfamily N-acetyltransferase
VVRLAAPADWPRVLELMGQTPMSASLPLAIERARDPALAYPALGGESVGLLAERGGALVGYLHAGIETRASWDGRALRPAPVLYVGDLRVAAGHQRSGVARALGVALFEQARARGVTAGFTLVNEGNRGALAVLRSNPSWRVTVLRTFTTASRLLWRKPAPGISRLVPAATDESDLEPLIVAWRGRLFGPWTDAESLRRFLRDRPEVTLYRRADEAAPLLALTDPARARRLFFQRLPPAFRALRAAWNGLRPLTGAPPFPGDGEPWCSLEVIFTRGPLSPDIEPQLLAEAHRRGAHALTAIESGLDGGALLRLSSPCHRLRTQLLMLTADDQPPPPPDLPAQVDLAFV